MNTHCSTEILESALNGNLPANDEAVLQEHLEHCAECSAALERMAGGQDWCSEAAALLAVDDLDSAVPTHDKWSEIDFTVEHLEPADEPNLLGRLGGYDILEIIGHGGMGVVLKAYDRELKRSVAIKVLAPHLASSSLARKRFAREAQAAAAVVHQHVLAIHQVQPTGRLPFLVMPLVAGESLAQRLAARGTLELKEILRIGMQAAAGLSAAHEQGLVHRDVKPANILLEKGVERAVLTDFGLARAADDVALTRWGVIAGTPQYMSPEQARGEQLDGRSDLFSLGCVLYEMASGVSPFKSDSLLATMRRLVDDSPQALSSLNPELPPWFIAIVDRLLAKDPTDRFNSAKEVSELLENCLAHVQQPTVVPLPADLPKNSRSPETRFRLRNLLSLSPPRERAGVRGLFSLSLRRERAGERVGRKRRFAILLLLAPLLAAAAFMLATGEPSNIAGQYTGEEWGTVELKQTATGEYAGTYTDTFTREPGQLELKWSRIERRYNGTWRENDSRFGDISVREVNNELRGAWTTSRASKLNPDTPHLADLLWIRAKQPSEIIKKPLSENNARDAAEAYVAAAIAGNLTDAYALAVEGKSPSRPSRIKDFEMIAAARDPAKVGTNLPRSIKIADVRTNSPFAFAISEEVKISPPNPDGRDTGYLTFDLLKQKGKWLIDDIDFDTKQQSQEKLKAFLQKYPDATVISSASDAPPTSGQKPTGKLNAREVVQHYLSALQNDEREVLRRFSADEQLKFQTLDTKKGSPIRPSMAHFANIRPIAHVSRPEDSPPPAPSEKQPPIEIDQVYINNEDSIGFAVSKPAEVIKTSGAQPTAGYFTFDLRLIDGAWRVTELWFRNRSQTQRALHSFQDENPRTVEVPPPAATTNQVATPNAAPPASALTAGQIQREESRQRIYQDAHFGPIIERTLYDFRIGKDSMLDLAGGKLRSLTPQPDRTLDQAQQGAFRDAEILAYSDQNGKGLRLINGVAPVAGDWNASAADGLKSLFNVIDQSSGIFPRQRGVPAFDLPAKGTEYVTYLVSFGFAPCVVQVRESKDNPNQLEVRYKFIFVGPNPREAAERYVAAGQTSATEELQRFTYTNPVRLRAAEPANPSFDPKHLANMQPAAAPASPGATPQPIRFEKVYVANRRSGFSVPGIAISTPVRWTNPQPNHPEVGHLILSLAMNGAPGSYWGVSQVRFENEANAKKALEDFQKSNRDAVEIRQENASPEASKKKDAEPNSAVSFSAPISKEVWCRSSELGSNALRLRDGKIFNLPKYLTFLQEPAQGMSIEEQQKWLEQSDINFAINYLRETDQWQIRLRNVKFAALPDDSWTKLLPDDLYKKFTALPWQDPEKWTNPATHTTTSGIQTLTFMVGATAPMTFAFETMGGERGILQFQAWNDQSRGRNTIIRYKLLQLPKAVNASAAPVNADLRQAPTFEPIDCTLVDEKSGLPVPGKDFAINLRFVIPRKAGQPWRLVDEVFLGASHAGTFAFTIPEKVFNHPDRDLIVVECIVVHPRLNQADGPNRVRVNEVLYNDPRTARDTLRRIKLRPANLRSGELPERFDEFTAKFQILRSLRMEEIGRDELVGAYERLIEKHSDHPDRAAPMIEIASAWQSGGPTTNYQPNYEKEIEWLRKASVAAKPGTKLWFDARFRLQGQLHWKAPDEAVKILEEILASNPGPVNEVRGWYYLQSLALNRKDEKEAEKICRQLQERMSRNEQQPAGMSELGDYFSWIQESANIMLNYWAQQHDVQLTERTAKIDKLRSDYPFRHMQAWSMEQFGVRDRNLYGSHRSPAPAQPPEAQPKQSDAGPSRDRSFSTPENVKTIACSPNGKLIAVANGNPPFILQTDGTSKVKDNWQPSLKILDAETGAILRTLALNSAEELVLVANGGLAELSQIEALAFSPDGNTLAVGTSIGQVKLFNAQTGEFVRSLDDEKQKLADDKTSQTLKMLRRAHGSVKSLKFSPDGSQLATCGESFADHALATNDTPRFSRMGLTATGPGRLKLWDAATGELQQDLPGYSHAEALAFSPVGELLACAGRWSSFTGVQFWKTEPRAKTANTPLSASSFVIEANGGANSVAFAPNGKLMAIGSRVFDKDSDKSSTNITVLHPATGIVEWQRSGPGWARPLAFSPDGNHVLALCGGTSIRWFEVATGKTSHEMKSTDNTAGITWSDFAIAPQANLLFTGGTDAEKHGTVGVWKLGEAPAEGK